MALKTTTKVPQRMHGGIGNRANCVRIVILNRDERGDLTHVFTLVQHLPMRVEKINR